MWLSDILEDLGFKTKWSFGIADTQVQLLWEETRFVGSYPIAVYFMQLFSLNLNGIVILTVGLLEKDKNT